MKHLLLLIAAVLTLNASAQDPAGTCMFIDYDAFQDDGILRYINCGNDDSFNVGASLTIQCWTRINDTNWNQKVCGKNNGNFNSGYVMAVDQGDVYGEIWNPMLNEIHDGFIPPLQLWYHLAITFEAGETMRGYVNGEMVEEVNVSGNDIATNVDDFIIGIAPWDLSNFQTFGELDELSVHNTAWTEQKIKDNMFKSAAASDLVAYYNFNDASGTVLTDGSANGNNGELVGLTTNDWAPSRAPVGDATITDQENVVGLWNGVTFSDPRFVITENGLSMSASGLEDLDYCVYGHDGGSGVQDASLPAGAPANFESTGRSWYLNEVGIMESTLTFNLANAAGGGDAIDDTQLTAHYTLMYRGDTASEWQFLAQANEVTSGVVIFEDFALATGYYAVGVGDGPAVITTGLEPDSALAFQVYPNPASDQLTLDLTQHTAGNALVRLMDAQGKLSLTQMVQGQTVQTIDIASLESGTYVLHVETHSGIYSQVVVVE